MSTERAIKKAVEKIISMLPANIEGMSPDIQILHLDAARNQIDGISWLLVVDCRWNSPIGEWVKAQLKDMDHRIDIACNAKTHALSGGRDHEAA